MGFIIDTLREWFAVVLLDRPGMCCRGGVPVGVGAVTDGRLVGTGFGASRACCVGVDAEGILLFAAIAYMAGSRGVLSGADVVLPT